MVSNSQPTLAVRPSCTRLAEMLRIRAYCCAFVAMTVLVCGDALLTSDHADPIDPFHLKKPELNITDLFVFPVLENGEVAFPFVRTDAISLDRPDLKPRDPLS